MITPETIKEKRVYAVRLTHTDGTVQYGGLYKGRGPCTIHARAYSKYGTEYAAVEVVAFALTEAETWRHK